MYFNQKTNRESIRLTDPLSLSILLCGLLLKGMSP